MGNTKSEQFYNDFDIEISSLDESETATTSSQPLPHVRRSGLSPRQHRQYLLLLNVILILSVIILVFTTTSLRGLVSGVFHRPMPVPTATIVPGTDLFYIRADVPWGQLFVDGHPISLPAISIAPPLRFARGQYQLSWRAAPFLAQQCMISVPPNFADTCNDRETAQVSSGLSAWVISFSESLTTLAATPRTTLLQTIQTALDARQSSDIVRPGEYYMLAPNDPSCKSNQARRYRCTATSSQPLRATLSFQLDTNEASQETCIAFQPGNCTLNNQDCRLLCTDFFYTASSSTREWNVFAPVLSLWTFATMDGRVLARNVPDDSAQDYATGQTLDESLMPLYVTWNSQGWHVALSSNIDSPSYSGSSYFDPVCAAMTQQVKTLNSLTDANGASLSLQWQFASGTLPAAGCQARGIPQPDGGLASPTPSHVPQPVPYYLQRFGVLLAVNKLAQSLEPSLPRLDAYEQQLARGLTRGFF